MFNISWNCLTLTMLDCYAISYAYIVAPDQPAHPHSPRRLIRELHCPLSCRIGYHWWFSGQCSSLIRLRGCAGWSRATLSTFGKWKILVPALWGLKTHRSTTFCAETQWEEISISNFNFHHYTYGLMRLIWCVYLYIYRLNNRKFSITLAFVS